MRRAAGACALLTLLASCAGAQGADPAARPSSSAAAGDTARRALVPPGFGTLRQDDVALALQVGGALIRLVPLDEGIIRLLSPDSYRALRDLQESRRAEIARLAARHGLHERNVWYASFFGLEPDARFSPMELRVTSAGRDFRPLEVIPLSAGFGEQRLRQRETQSALVLFEDGLDVAQPLTVSVEGAQNAGWSATLRVIERERALVRSRAARGERP